MRQKQGHQMQNYLALYTSAKLAGQYYLVIKILGFQVKIHLKIRIRGKIQFFKQFRKFLDVLGNDHWLGASITSRNGTAMVTNSTIFSF